MAESVLPYLLVLAVIAYFACGMAYARAMLRYWRYSDLVYKKYRTVLDQLVEEARRNERVAHLFLMFVYQNISPNRLISELDQELTAGREAVQGMWEKLEHLNQKIVSEKSKEERASV